MDQHRFFFTYPAEHQYNYVIIIKCHYYHCDHYFIVSVFVIITYHTSYFHFTSFLGKKRGALQKIKQSFGFRMTTDNSSAPGIGSYRPAPDTVDEF